MMTALGKLLTNNLRHRPILVMGTNRSGTTILLRALGQHPQIISSGKETPFLNHVGHIPYLYRIDSAKDYYVRSLAFSEEYLMDTFRQLCFESVMGRYYGLRRFLGTLRRGDFSILQKRHWCAKTFPDFEQAQGILEFFPEAKFVHIVRNGCDVVQSRTLFHAFRDRDFVRQCEDWAESVRMYRYILKLDCAIQIRHEQVVSQPDDVFQKICAFIRLPYDSRLGEFAKKTLIHPGDQPTMTGMDVQSILKNRAPSYSSWSAEQREIFKRICGDGMGELGYELPF